MEASNNLLLDQFHSDMLVVLNSGLTENSIVQTSELIEENTQKVNDIFLNYFASSGLEYIPNPPSGEGEVAESPALDPVPVAELLSIAEQCPLSGGNAVYRARAMYSNIDPEKTYDNSTICLTQGIMYRQQKKQISTSTFRVFPNPAYDQVNINYQIGDDQQADLLIRNSLGQILQKHVLFGNKKDLNLNIQMLANGIYTVQMVLQKEIIQQEKLVILR